MADTEKFALIAVTPPHFYEAEPRLIALMLDSGVIDRVHIRKPSASEDDISRLVSQVPSRLRGRLSIHRLPALALRLATGVHFPGLTSPEVIIRAREQCFPAISVSCHSVDECSAYRHLTDYRFLSPMFDSISKPGYKSAFTHTGLLSASHAGLIDSRTIALGGINPDRLPLLASYGFGGAALSGFLFPSSGPDDLLPKLECLRRHAPVHNP